CLSFLKGWLQMGLGSKRKIQRKNKGAKRSGDLGNPTRRTKIWTPEFWYYKPGRSEICSCGVFDLRVLNIFTRASGIKSLRVWVCKNCVAEWEKLQHGSNKPRNAK